LVESLADENVVTANLVCTQLHADDLLKMVAYSFGVDTNVVEKAELLQRLEVLLQKWNRESRRALLIVDEAQDLSVSAMEELRLLTNIQVNGKPLLQIFLLGQAELRDLILSPKMEQFHQRIIAGSHLEALEKEETEAYIIHRLEKVGWCGDPAISKSVFPLIYKFSDGIPRRINLICSRLFLHGSVEQRHRIGVLDVKKVIQELQGEHLTVGKPLADYDFTVEDVFEDVVAAVTEPATEATPENVVEDVPVSASVANIREPVNFGPRESEELSSQTNAQPTDQGAAQPATNPTGNSAPETATRGRQNATHNISGGRLHAVGDPAVVPVDIPTNKQSPVTKKTVLAGHVPSKPVAGKPASRKARGKRKVPALLGIVVFLFFISSLIFAANYWPRNWNGVLESWLARASTMLKKQSPPPATPPVSIKKSNENRSGSEGNFYGSEGEASTSKNDSNLANVEDALGKEAQRVGAEPAAIEAPQVAEFEILARAAPMGDSESNPMQAVESVSSDVEQERGPRGVAELESLPDLDSGIKTMQEPEMVTEPVPEPEPLPWRVTESEQAVPEAGLVTEPEKVEELVTEPEQVETEPLLVTEPEETEPESLPVSELDPQSRQNKQASVQEPDFTLTFSFDSVRLSPDSQRVLDNVLDILMQSNNSSVTVTGYSDGEGSIAYSQGLSKWRAAVVAEYLQSRGITADRVLVEGRGEFDQGLELASEQGDSEEESHRIVQIELHIAEL
jgi:type II secretory pathway predicted ATPase ExeA/outer membrane protein OmpA-like peptidoglycan-associated protein